MRTINVKCLQRLEGLGSAFLKIKHLTQNSFKSLNDLIEHFEGLTLSHQVFHRTCTIDLKLKSLNFASELVEEPNHKFLQALIRFRTMIFQISNVLIELSKNPDIWPQIHEIACMSNFVPFEKLEHFMFEFIQRLESFWFSFSKAQNFRLSYFESFNVLAWAFTKARTSWFDFFKKLRSTCEAVWKARTFTVELPKTWMSNLELFRKLDRLIASSF